MSASPVLPPGVAPASLQPLQREQRKLALRQASLAQRRELRAGLDRLAARADRLEADLLRVRAVLVSPLGLLGVGVLAWLLVRLTRRGGPRGGPTTAGAATGRPSRGRWLRWGWQAWQAWRTCVA